MEAKERWICRQKTPKGNTVHCKDRETRGKGRRSRASPERWRRRRIQKDSGPEQMDRTQHHEEQRRHEKARRRTQWTWNRAYEEWKWQCLGRKGQEGPMDLVTAPTSIQVAFLAEYKSDVPWVRLVQQPRGRVEIVRLWRQAKELADGWRRKYVTRRLAWQMQRVGIAPQVK